MTILEIFFSNSLTIFFSLGFFIKDTCIESICFKITYINNTSTVKHLRIYLQFFQILKVKDTRLEI